MIIVYGAISLLVGAAVWALFVYKWPDVVPFAKRNMEERRTRIAAQLEQAEASKKLLAHVQDEIAKDLANAKQQADEIVARAKKEAADEAAEIRARGDRDAAAMLERAKADIGSERDAAINAIRHEVATVVVDASGAVLAKALDDQGHRRLINESLTHVSKNS